MNGERDAPTASIALDEVPEADARRELDRIVADPEFHCTQRNRKFLKFVAEEYFRGRGSAVKAYTVAVDVFGRAPTFDPSTDPIVRIEATRLRTALVRYYELHERPVRISLPKGHYVPVFSKAAEYTQNATAEPEPSEQNVSSGRAWPVNHFVGRLKTLPVIVGIACVAMLGGFLLVATSFKDPNPDVSEKPHLVIETRVAGNSGEDDAIAIRDALIVALSGFQTLRISAPDAATASTGLSAGRIGRQTGVQHGYRLVLKYNADPAGGWLRWQVMDETNGEVLRSAAERIDQGEVEQAGQQIASQLAVRLAANHGIISTAETARELDNPTLGNGCILRSILAMDSRETEALREARLCLESTLALRRNDADAHAILAGVLLKLEAPDARTFLTDQAVRIANRAVALAPDSDRSYYAQMVAQFKVGNLPGAIAAGRRALELNPNNPVTVAKLAKILFVTGQWDEGAALARTAQGPGMLPADAAATLAFDAYRRGQFDEALQLLNLMDDQNCLQLLRVATLGQLGRIREANEAVADLRRSHPQFEGSVRADLKHRQFAPSLIALVEVGLLRAGLKIA